MNIIIPLGGLGGRFSNCGYLMPKPMVRILGKEMILWVLDYLYMVPGDRCYIVYNPLLMDQHLFENTVLNKCQAKEFVTFVHLEGTCVRFTHTLAHECTKAFSEIKVILS
jgi:NDP-sugar pyrophosphorylase family protein